MNAMTVESSARPAPAGHTTSGRLGLRLGAACGLAHVVLEFVGFGIGAASGSYAIDSYSSTAEIAKAIAQPATIGGWIGAYLEVVAFLAFIAFAARLWATLRRAEGEPAWLAATALGAGLLFVGLTLVAFAAGGAAYYRAGHGLDVQVARALSDVGQACFILTWAVGAVFLGASALVILGWRALPRWLGWSAALLALTLLAAVAVPTSTLAMIPVFLFYGWLVAASIVLLREPAAEQDRPVIAATAS